MPLWDDTEITIAPDQRPFNHGVLQGVIEWYMSTHAGHLPMAVRLAPRHWGIVASSLKNNCERQYGVPVLPAGGFQNEDPAELEWIP